MDAITTTGWPPVEEDADGCSQPPGRSRPLQPLKEALIFQHFLLASGARILV
jgi:hypothetical protein